MRPETATTRNLLYAASIALAGIAVVATPATSAPTCGARIALVDQLDKKFREKPAAIGLTGGGTRLAELYVSEGGSWTLIVTTPKGQACVLATGVSWEAIPVHFGPEA